MRIVCQQTILLKYHTLFVIFERSANLILSSVANYGALWVKGLNLYASVVFLINLALIDI